MIITRERDIYKIYSTEKSRRPYIYDAETRAFYLTTGREGYPSNNLVAMVINILKKPPIKELFNRIISYPASQSIKENYYQTLAIWRYNHAYNLDIDEQLFNQIWKKILFYLKKEENFIDVKDFIFKVFYSDMENLLKKCFSEEALTNEISSVIEKDYGFGGFFNYHVPVFQMKAWREDIKHIYKLHQSCVSEIDACVKCSPTIVHDMPSVFENFKQTEYRNFRNSIRHSLSMAVKVLELKEKLGYSDYKIKNLSRAFDFLQMEWDKHKYDYDNKVFESNQTKCNLSFETQDYKIYVPTSRVDLQKIADYFHNCANNHEWEYYLKDKERYLVVVVNKTTNTWEVCCDIDCDFNSICQYLMISNRRCTDEKLLAFKKEYQEYLNTLLRKQN